MVSVIQVPFGDEVFLRVPTECCVVLPRVARPITSSQKRLDRTRWRVLYPALMISIPGLLVAALVYVAVFRRRRQQEQLMNANRSTRLCHIDTYGLSNKIISLLIAAHYVLVQLHHNTIAGNISAFLQSILLQLT